MLKKDNMFRVSQNPVLKAFNWLLQLLVAVAGVLTVVITLSSLWFCLYAMYTNDWQRTIVSIAVGLISVIMNRLFYM